MGSNGEWEKEVKRGKGRNCPLHSPISWNLLGSWFCLLAIASHFQSLLIANYIHSSLQQSKMVYLLTISKHIISSLCCQHPSPTSSKCFSTVPSSFSSYLRHCSESLLGKLIYLLQQFMISCLNHDSRSSSVILHAVMSNLCFMFS